MAGVGGVEWLSRPALAVLPVAQQVRVAPAWHTVFRYTASLAGSLPLLAAVYGVTVGRLRYLLVPVDVPLAYLPPSLDGLRRDTPVNFLHTNIGDGTLRSPCPQDLSNDPRQIAQLPRFHEEGVHP